MRLLIPLAALALLSGCASDDLSPPTIGSTPTPSMSGPPQNVSLPRIVTLVDAAWSATDPTPSVDFVDHEIARWAVAEPLAFIWINVTVEREAFTVFASNAAYQGPGEAFEENYGQDGFTNGKAGFVVRTPIAGDWVAYFRNSPMEPNGVSEGHVTVTAAR